MTPYHASRALLGRRRVHGHTVHQRRGRRIRAHVQRRLTGGRAAHKELRDSVGARLCRCSDAMDVVGRNVTQYDTSVTTLTEFHTSSE